MPIVSFLIQKKKQVHFGMACKYAPENPSYWTDFGITYLNEGNTDKAIKVQLHSCKAAFVL